jgi:hypothetical protein
MRNRECVKKPSSRLGLTYSDGANFALLSFPPEDGVKDLWYLFDDGSWVALESKIGVAPKVLDKGNWECYGNENFKIVAGGWVYTSDIDDWVEKPPVEQEPEEEPEQSTEPNFDRTKFPLKKGSEGKEVIQLQNYLNKEIPADPLVIDGIFGDLTHNKLVQVQKNKGVL